jgi:pantoate--beta-alanine ligase
MELIRDPSDLRTDTDAARARGDSVALVPTMGALHDGHRSLIEAAGRAQTTVVVSIFVNPRQFADLAICEQLGVDVVWAPSSEQVYPPGLEVPSADPGPVGSRFEGASRPGHFEGVLMVVHRLFDVAGPCTAWFGEKDAQQVFLVRRMIETERLPVSLAVAPTVREPDGLALSSRNTRLSPEERDQAGCLFLALSEAAALARAGVDDAGMLVAAMAREVGATPLARLDYAAVVDDATFEPLTRRSPGTTARALIAARFPSARLIDNLRLPEPP